MSDWPQVPLLEPGPTLWTGSLEASAPDLTGGGNAPVNAVSAAWPAANRAYGWAFYHLGSKPFTSALAFWLNGATVSGNCDFGIYDAKFQRIASTGSVAQAGVNVLQSVALVVTLPPGGPYHFALACDNLVATHGRTSPFLSQVNFAGGFMMVGAFPLPATLTAVQFGTANMLPVCGLTRRSFL